MVNMRVHPTRSPSRVVAESVAEDVDMRIASHRRRGLAAHEVLSPPASTCHYPTWAKERCRRSISIEVLLDS